jgi:hypothetical protein
MIWNLNLKKVSITRKKTLYAIIGLSSSGLKVIKLSSEICVKSQGFQVFCFKEALEPTSSKRLLKGY